jgi:hypothetical protein
MLYSFAIDQLCSVQSQVNHGSWNILLMQPLSATAQQQYQQLMTILSSEYNESTTRRPNQPTDDTQTQQL